MDAKEEIEFAFYDQRTTLNLDRFQEELCDQPELVRNVGMRMAYAKAAVRTAKAELKRVEAELHFRVRDELGEAGESTAAANVSAGVQKHRRRRRAEEELLEAEFRADKWEQLDRAIRERGFMLKILGEGYVAGFLTPRSIRSNGGSAFGMTEQAVTEAREGIAKKRPSLQELRDRVSGAKPAKRTKKRLPKNR